MHFKMHNSPDIIKHLNPPYYSNSTDEILPLIRTQGTVGKLIEKEPNGPIKNVAIMSNQIASIALQEEVCQQ